MTDPIIILDDLKARNLAESYQLKLTGTLGILLKAKQKGIIPSIAEILLLLEGHQFRISDSLKENVLRLGGEL